MIALFGAYIKTIVVFLIFAAFAEMVMPDSNFRKYIGVILGLFMILTLLNPLLKLTKGFDFDLSELIGESSLTAKFPQEKIEKNRGNQLVTEIYKEELKDSVEENLKQEGFFISSVQVEVEEEPGENYGSILSVEILLGQEKLAKLIQVEPVRAFAKEEKNQEEKQEGSEEQKKIQRIMEKNYGVRAEKVRVELQR